MTLKTAIAAITFAALSALAANAAGFTKADVPAAHRESPLKAFLFYPSNEDGTEIELGKNAVFTGVPARVSATPKSGSYPLVVLSHGSGGNAINIAWLAAHLADQGMIVIATNHPGTTSGDSDPFKTLKLWERPADISALIDHAQSDLPLGLKADTSRIASIGFSLGGYTALASGGARVSKADYISYCDANSGRLDCGWFQKAGVDFTKIDQNRYEQSNRDPRITAVVAIDPAVAQAYQADSLTAMSLPVQIINLGAKGEIPEAVEAAPIMAHLPNATLEYVAQATHFSFLGECTTKGWLIIKLSGEDPICSETGNRDRADIHKELKSKIAGFLAKNL